jgi:hypothetical protein
MTSHSEFRRYFAKRQEDQSSRAATTTRLAPWSQVFAKTY